MLDTCIIVPILDPSCLIYVFHIVQTQVTSILTDFIVILRVLQYIVAFIIYYMYSIIGFLQYIYLAFGLVIVTYLHAKIY